MTAGLDEVVKAFLGLYTRESLPRWRELFLPGFVAAAANADGSITTWTLDEFYERQRALFATGKPVSETMMNTHIERTGDIACVRSDYLWTDGEAKRPGRLMMILVAGRGGFRIQSLAFSYLG
ncbi:MAG TPA: nuclear transport factor 2 family protein [Burkholderiales bacterium]|nr:nuclear transport factor 2 family protein [Burkholderiales bacterium]